MSKNIKIVGVLVGAAVLWLGTTAYIGSNTESYLTKHIDKTNKLYAQNGVKVTVDSYEKGFFASKATMRVDFLEPDIQEALSEILTLPIEVDYRIQNGPIFFEQGVGMGASRIVQDIKLSEHVVDKEAFKKLFKDDIKIESITDIDFSNNASFLLNTNAIKANIEETELEMSPLKMEGDINIESLVGQFKMWTDSVTVKADNDSLLANTVEIDGDITKFYENGFYLGDFAFNVGSLSTKGDVLPFSLEDAKASLLMNIEQNKDETINMKFKMDADVGNSKLPAEYTPLNKVRLSYALNGTKLEGILAFQDFTKELQAKQQALMMKLSSSANGELDMNALSELEKLQLQAQEGMIPIMAGLLKKDSTNFVFETTVIDKKAKESSIKMNVGYVGDEVLPTDAKALEAKFMKEFLNLLTININIDLNKEYISNLPVELQQELAGQLQMGAMFGIVQDNNTSYNFDAQYKPKTLTVNGQDRTEMLQMLQMGLAQ